MLRQSGGQVYQPNFSDLYNLMYPEVVEWLDVDIKRFLQDYLTIKAHTTTYPIDDLWDYSYLITPAFKALEGTLFKIGEELGLDVKKHEYRVGAIFDEKALEEYYDKVLEKIKALSDEQKVDVKQWLDNAKRILKSLRHTPAHFKGEAKDNPEKAFMSGNLILSTINEMCHTLIQNRLFYSIILAEQKKLSEQKKKIIAIKSAGME